MMTSFWRYTMRADALLATVPSYFSRQLKIVNAWGLVLLGYFLLTLGASGAPAESWYVPSLIFISFGACSFGTHLYGLRLLGRRHRWPDAERTQLTVAFLASVLLFCLLPGALVGSAGASGIGMALAAWAAVGLAVGFSQLIPSLTFFLLLVCVAIIKYPSTWPSPTTLAADPSGELLAGWFVLGALGWLVAAAGLPFGLRVRDMAQPVRGGARRGPVAPPDLLSSAPRSRRSPGPLRRLGKRLYSLRPSRLWSTLVSAFIFSLFIVKGPLEPFASTVVFMMSLLMPGFIAVSEVEFRMPYFKREFLFPVGRRDFAKELTVLLMVEVFFHWLIVVSAGAFILITSSAEVPGGPGQLGFFLVATLLFQPVWLAAPLAFLGVRPDRVWRRVAAGLGVVTVGLLIVVFSEASGYAWVFAVAPGSDTWVPWLTALMLGFGGLVVAAAVARFDRLELGRFVESFT
ncbi:MAG: hypothetical protein AAFY88_02530 [Acidobacteriota bacterium]